MTSGGEFRSGIAWVMLEPSYRTGWTTKGLIWDYMVYIDTISEVTWGSLR